MRDFAAEAERKRREGDARAAVALARQGLAADPANSPGRIALALALIDLGDVDGAREQLEAGAPAAAEPAEAPRALEHGVLGADLGEDELETAFARAETNPDEMLSANKVVEQTLANEQVDVAEGAFDVTGSSTYATETMATLLEGQGRVGDAEVLRESFVRFESDFLEDDHGDPATEADNPPGRDFQLETAPVSPGAGIELEPEAGHADRTRIIATLEHWLDNLRQGGAQVPQESRRGAGGLSSS